jgi:hypothetical protein
MDWAPSGASNATWLAVASSADGNRLVAVGDNGIYTSSDSGATWSSNNASAPYANWESVASSADGIKLAAGCGGNGGLIYTNSAMTWTSNNVPVKVWHSIASSAEGIKLVAGCYPSIYTSTNSGANWISNSAPGLSWRSVASSADGSKLVAVTFPGGIYTWQSTPTPSLNIMLTNGGLTLSWLVPSTNFVVQQSADLISWAGITNQVALNLTNLQSQVMLPPSGSSAFYRLATH